MISTQFYLFIHLLLYGALMAQLLDTYMVIMKKCQKQWCRVLSYLLFWLVQCFFLVLYIYVVSGGEIQSYLVILLLAGAILYRYFLQATYHQAFYQFISRSKIMIFFLIKIFSKFFLKPFDFIFQKIFAILKAIVSIFTKDIEENEENAVS